MTVVIRQEAKFSFMPEILAADIVVGACEGKKNCFLVGLFGRPRGHLLLPFSFESPVFSNLLTSKHPKTLKNVFLRLP